MAAGARETVPARTVFLNGTVGSGKTATAAAIGAALQARGAPHATIDLDALSARWPRPRADPFDFRLALANLASVSANYRHAGAAVTVVAGVLETRAQHAAVEDSVRVGGGTLAHVMLVAPPKVVEQRLRARHSDQAELAWHLHRAPELAATLASAGLPGPTVDTNRPLHHVAQHIVRAVLDR